jgi:superoxide dismutase, Cu-Zn family
MSRILAAVCSAALVLSTSAAAPAQTHDHSAMASMTVSPAPIRNAVAVLNPTAGNNCHGVIRFTQDGDAVKVVADIEGLTPGQQHAIHVHDFGDCSAPDATSAGSHYNPEGHQHGLPATSERHAGDLGNLTADKDGKAHYEITVTNCSLAGAMNPILGRAVIVHAKLDDGGQPVGNAGARIACGVIGVAKPPESK